MQIEGSEALEVYQLAVWNILPLRHRLWCVSLNVEHCTIQC